MTNGEKDDEEFVLSQEMKDELDRRLAEYEADPLGGEPWEKVKARILNRPDPPRNA